MANEFTITKDKRSFAFTDTNLPQNYHKYLEPYLFTPWAERLLDFASIQPGQSVLDVASGTGAVACAAIRRVAPSGRVTASDISPVMLAMIVNHDNNAAAIDTIHCPATNLKVSDHSFDRVLCQHGLPFIHNRVTALREMRRAAKYGGVVCVSVFTSSYRVEPFETYLEVLRDHGIAPPFSNAFDKSTYVMSENDVTDVFSRAGFSKIKVYTEQLEVSWPDAETVAAGLFGTPFGTVVTELEPFLRQHIVQTITVRFDGDRPVRRITKSILARALG